MIPSSSLKLAVTAALAIPSLAGAVQITADPFLTGANPAAGEYTTGATNLVGQNPAIVGFNGSWLEAYSGAQSADVLDTGLSYPGLPSSGGSIRYTGAGNGRSGRLLSSPFGDSYSGALYLSVLLQLEAANDAYSSFELHNGGFDDGGNRTLQIAAGEPSDGLIPAGEFALRLNNTGGTSLGSLDAEVNLFVVRIDFSTDPASDSVSVYRNPSDLAVEANNTVTASLSGVDFRFDRTSFARFNDSTGIGFDELRIGTAYNDVTGTVNPDADGDGLDDGWEFTNMVDDPDEDAAHDDDGLTNLEEFLAWTDPNKADTDDDGIEDKPELDGTGNAYDGMPTDARVADTDGDGLTDGEEISAANGFVTDPNTPDTDGDGESDAIEIANSTDPLDAESNSSAAGVIAIDGIRDDRYGDALAVQSVETGFGDNLSELDAGYATVEGGKLYLMLTGNVEANFNKLEIFIDSEAGGSEVLSTAGNDGSGPMDGLTFDTGFAPDYHLIVRRGADKFDLDFAKLGTGEYASYMRVFGAANEGFADTAAPTTSTFAIDPSPIRVAYDNSNTAGVGGSAGLAADVAAALAVETGLELCIDLADLGNPGSPVRICAFQNNSAHDFASNQFLGGLPEGSGNLGNLSAVDLSFLDGEQFFTIPVPEVDVQITAISVDDATGEVAITFTSTSGRSYLIEDSTDLSAWMELDDGFSASAGESSTYTRTEALPIPAKKFYRITPLAP